jgi:hypothetical protein
MDGTYRDETSLRFLHPISNRDKNVRKHAFDATTRTIETWLTGYATPFNSLESIASVNGVGNNIAIAKLQERVPDLLRLVCGCPFKDIRDKSKCLLDDLKVYMFIDICSQIVKTLVQVNHKLHVAVRIVYFCTCNLL